MSQAEAYEILQAKGLTSKQCSEFSGVDDVEKIVEAYDRAETAEGKTLGLLVWMLRNPEEALEANPPGGRALYMSPELKRNIRSVLNSPEGMSRYDGETMYAGMAKKMHTTPKKLIDEVMGHNWSVTLPKDPQERERWLGSNGIAAMHERFLEEERG